MRRSYDYLGEQKITIDTSKGLSDRVQENIEEPPLPPGDNRFLIKVVEPNHPIQIVKDRRLPFASTRENWSRPYMGADLFRYGTRVRTIWRKSSSEYEVETTTELDEKAVLKCFKNLYFENASQGKFLLHSALVNVNHQGILITGKCRSGKSTLTQGLATLQPTIITGGNTLISSCDGELTGDYIPRPFYIRFSGIVSHPALAPLMEDIGSCNAVQYLDDDTIKRIISSKAFEVDAGLCISRKRYADLLGVNTDASSRVDTIIFTQYAPGSPKVEECTPEEAADLVKARVFPKKTDLLKIETTDEIVPPQIDLSSDFFSKLRLIKLSFSGDSSLTQGLLEDLVDNKRI